MRIPRSPAPCAPRKPGTSIFCARFWFARYRYGSRQARLTHWIRTNDLPNTRILHGEYKTDSFPTLRIGFHKPKTDISGWAAPAAQSDLTASVLLPGRLRSLLRRFSILLIFELANFGLPLETGSITSRTMSWFPITILRELTPSNRILTDRYGPFFTSVKSEFYVR